MKRRYRTVRGHSGIFTVEVFDETTLKWKKPGRGGGYASDGYVFSSNIKRRQRRHFDTFLDAKEFRLGKKNENFQTNPILNEQRPANGLMLFRDLVTIWCNDWLPNKDVSTQIRYKSYLKHFNFFMDLPVEQIGPSTIDQWIVNVKKPEYLAIGNQTRCNYNHEFSVLKGILNYYSSRFNRNYRLPFIKDHRSMLKVREMTLVNKDLTVDQFTAFMDNLKAVCTENNCEVIYYLARMQYALYCRVQEAAALYVEDFDLVRNKVTVKRKVQWLRAKGFEHKIVDGSKSNGGKELPTIPDLALSVLKEWMLKSGTRSGLLFHIDGKIISYRQIEYRYTQALKRAGLPFSATHILRHASLSEHYGACKNVYATKAAAGHSDLRSTMKYVKVRSEDVAAAQKLMDQRLSHLL